MEELMKPEYALLAIAMVLIAGVFYRVVTTETDPTGQISGSVQSLTSKVSKISEELEEVRTQHRNMNARLVTMAIDLDKKSAPILLPEPPKTMRLEVTRAIPITIVPRNKPVPVVKRSSTKRVK